MIEYYFLAWSFPIGAILVTFLEPKKNRIGYLAGLLITFLLIHLIKMTFDVPRPEDALVVLESARFPSGHAAMAFYPLGHFLKSKNSGLIFLLALFAVVGSYSRIYLGVHEPIDLVVGGMIALLVGEFIHRTNSK